MDDAISRHGTSAWLENMGHPTLAKMVMDEKRFPSAQPYTIHSDGRLWVTVDDIDKVNAVVVDESKSKFCKQFYMDAQPEITRCKDCKYWHSGSCECPEYIVFCQDYMVGDIETEAEHFCGYAERREDG